MPTRQTLLVLIAAAAFVAAGCSSSDVRWTSAPPGSSSPPKELPPASSDAPYDYRVTNDGCNCVEYIARDEAARIEYRFRAMYKMLNGIHTEILCTIVNKSDDTLSFDLSAIKVASRNVRYQYNNRFLPLPWEPILPRSSGTRKLTGKEVTDESNWHKIAGEQLTVTLKGLMLAGRELKSQTLVFVPDNPNFGK